MLPEVIPEKKKPQPRSQRESNSNMKKYYIFIYTSFIRVSKFYVFRGVISTHESFFRRPRDWFIWKSSARSVKKKNVFGFIRKLFFGGFHRHT